MSFVFKFCCHLVVNLFTQAQLLGSCPLIKECADYITLAFTHQNNSAADIKTLGNMILVPSARFPSSNGGTMLVPPFYWWNSVSSTITNSANTCFQWAQALVWPVWLLPHPLPLSLLYLSHWRGGGGRSKSKLMVLQTKKLLKGELLPTVSSTSLSR